MKKLTLAVTVVCFIVLILAGGGIYASDTKKAPIKIGLLAERTGVLAAYGYSHEKVMKVAVNLVNEKGGILGRPIELYVEDTESKPAVGALKFRKLVESSGVSFVFNTNSSGIALACAPIAKELKTPYFPDVTATDLAGEKSNRYVFQITTNVKSECKGGADFAIKNLGKKWAIVVVNYAWGWSQEKEFKEYITAKGGTVLKSIKVPLGTGDWIPYLSAIPSEAEAVYFANFGSDFLSFLRDLHALRPDIKKLGAYYVLSGQKIDKLGAEGEGLYCLTSYPMRISGLDTQANRTYRKLIGVDENGMEISSGKYFVLPSDWCIWEAFFAVKAAIEKSGWASKADHPKLIKTLEGMAFKESLEFPQGDIRIRKEDHLAITGLYVEQVKNGDLKVITKIPAEETIYKPLVDRTKEEF